MPYVIGLTLSGAFAVFARYVGFDRDRAFYPTVMIVIASYYVLFAAMSGSIQTTAIEAVVMVLFAAAAVAGSSQAPGSSLERWPATACSMPFMGSSSRTADAGLVAGLVFRVRRGCGDRARLAAEPRAGRE